VPEPAQEWYERVSADGGHRPAEWPASPSYPLDDSGSMRRISPPASEPVREGEAGGECEICRLSKAQDPSGYIYWRDELTMLGVPFQPTALPLVTYLMPRRHADLGDLTVDEARRCDELLTYLERAACDVLDVPRVQVARYGEGAEHLHWWLLARPTGALDLRGGHLFLWDQVLPAREPTDRRADLDLLAARLVELAGGEALPGERVVA
jgi:diadenosine tetraphosphate (Ap4A) HIT family hydrolase